MQIRTVEDVTGKGSLDNLERLQTACDSGGYPRERHLRRSTTVLEVQLIAFARGVRLQRKLQIAVNPIGANEIPRRWVEN